MFDAAVIGGGLAGLSLSIQLSRAGYRTILFEKEEYPFHKVCGEYISFESKPFLEDLGVDLTSENIPILKNLLVTSPAGKKISARLEPGGFGVSRYLLDHKLYELAKKTGVIVREHTRVEDVQFHDDVFTISIPGEKAEAKIVAGCFGKRSNLEIKWNRPKSAKNTNQTNYIGVKYHIRIDFPEDVIALHNFEDGYCGISRIENGTYCLCYLSDSANLRKSGNSIPKMEAEVLSRNPFLKHIFEKATFLFDKPVTISQIRFHKKPPVQNHVLFAGDAAGMITPLCGNGMSMALHASKLLYTSIDAFLKKKISRQAMENQYESDWNGHFSKRLLAGRIIQNFFGKNWTTNLFINLLKYLPFLKTRLIKLTHGEEF